MDSLARGQRLRTGRPQMTQIKRIRHIPTCSLPYLGDLGDLRAAPRLIGCGSGDLVEAVQHSLRGGNGPLAERRGRPDLPSRSKLLANPRAGIVPSPTARIAVEMIADQDDPTVMVLHDGIDGVSILHSMVRPDSHQLVADAVTRTNIDQVIPHDWRRDHRRPSRPQPKVRGRSVRPTPGSAPCHRA